MATINYNGMELEEVTTPQIFDPPKTCVVWDENNEEMARADRVSAILPQSCDNVHHVVTSDGRWYNHCALLPDPPKPRRATNRELARWLAQGNGEVKYASQYAVKIKIEYGTKCDNDPCHESFKVRKWSDTEWHEPTADYLFGGDEVH